MCLCGQDGDDTAVPALQAEIEVARLTRFEEEWTTGAIPRESTDGASPTQPWVAVLGADFFSVDADGGVAEGPAAAEERLRAAWNTRTASEWAVLLAD